MSWGPSWGPRAAAPAGLALCQREGCALLVLALGRGSRRNQRWRCQPAGSGEGTRRALGSAPAGGRETVRHGAATRGTRQSGRDGADSVGNGGKRPMPDGSSRGCRGTETCLSRGQACGAGACGAGAWGAGERTHLVGDAVEHLHGQVRHVGVGVSCQVQQHAPYLRVHAVEGDAWGEGRRVRSKGLSPGGRATARPLLRAVMERRKVPAAALAMKRRVSPAPSWVTALSHVRPGGRALWAAGPHL